MGFRGVEERGYWGGKDFILITLDRHECFQFFTTCKRTNNANNTIHYVKLGKKRRESSKRNFYIISPRVIIKAIIDMKRDLYIWKQTYIQIKRGLNKDGKSPICIWTKPYIQWGKQTYSGPYEKRPMYRSKETDDVKRDRNKDEKSPVCIWTKPYIQEGPKGFSVIHPSP